MNIFMKSNFIVLHSFVMLVFVGCTRQKDLPVAGLPAAEKVVLADRYPTTPEELKLVDQLSKITGIFKVLYKDNANVRLVNASIYARVFSDETVLLGDLIFPAQSRLLQYPRFDSLSRVWQVDLTSFARQFWNEVRKRNDTEFEQFLQSLVPSSSLGNQFVPEDGTAPPVSVYYPYSENFSSTSGGSYLPTVSLLTATADTDQAPGSEPVYENGTLTGYTSVLINDEYAADHPTHIIGVNGPENPVEPVSGPGGGGVIGGFCFGPNCAGWIPPPPPPKVLPIEIKRSVLVENYVLKAQYDNLISFTGNGGGSEVRINRISSYLQSTVGPAVSNFAPLLRPWNAPSSYTFDQTLTSHTRQDISEKVWKVVNYWWNAHGESRWDTSWVQNNFEQALAIWEYDNTIQRTSFNGQLYTTLLQTTSSPMELVPGVKSYSVQVPSMHPPIKHLRILRSTYFGEARNNFDAGFRPGCGAPGSWFCPGWSDYAGLDTFRFVVPSPANQLATWPARDVHWETKAGAVFGWVWPYRVYYIGGGYPHTML
jgi:hypothetical protein